MKRYFLLLVTLFAVQSLTAQNFSSYLSYEDYVQYMQQTELQHKDICRLDTIGITNEGRLLLCMKISASPDKELNKPKFFYSSSMHGDELTGAVMLLRLIDSVVSNPQLTVGDSSFPVIFVCPYANPDGTWHGGNSTVSGAMRYNANYVDLNRNYPDIRTGKNSDGENIQTETQAFIAYQQKEKFNISCNLHGGSEVFNYPWDSYTSNRNKHADDSWFRQFGKDFVSSLNDESGKYFKDVNNEGVVEGGDWYVIHGSRQDWAAYFAHCREITLEVSMDKTPAANKLDGFWDKLKNSLFTAFDYCKLGFEGVVTDSITGQPLNNVMIEINDYDKDSSQVFTNLNGYWFRPVLSGNYTVTFSADGYVSKTMTIDVADNLNRFAVQLIPVNTRINEITNLNIEVYPSPAQNEITIVSDGACSYEITDINGKMCGKGKITLQKQTVNLKQLPAGTYIIKFNGRNNTTEFKKFIKR